MTEETLKALKESIAHWEELHACNTYDEINEVGGIGSSSCALCNMFHYPISTSSCIGCPVYESTGCANCGDSPYSEVPMAKIGLYGYVLFNRNYSQQKIWKDASRKQLEFLKGLLPK